MVRLYALVEAGDTEAIDVYRCEQDAKRALEDCLRGEPAWQGLLHVAEIEFERASPPSPTRAIRTRTWPPPSLATRTRTKNSCWLSQIV